MEREQILFEFLKKDILTAIAGGTTYQELLDVLKMIDLWLIRKKSGELK